MEQPGRLEAERTARPDEVGSKGRGHADLHYFDDIRAILVQTGLPPTPEIYELLYLYVTGADAALTRAMERALADGTLDEGAVRELRRAHLGDIAGAELLAMVESVQETANGLTQRLEQAERDLDAYDALLVDEEEALQLKKSVQELVEVVTRLRKANSLMQAANRVLKADVETAVVDTGRLLERLAAAERAARTDPLTGLLNRRGLTEALANLQAEARKTGAALSLALADIDHFKRMNDQWGHRVGDEVLRCVGGHLKASVQKQAGNAALVGRYGGEEFLAILPDVELARATAILDDSRARLARLVLRRKDDDATLGHISFSAGVALNRAPDTVETLIDRADSALYNAKSLGRDRVLPERSQPEST